MEGYNIIKQEEQAMNYYIIKSGKVSILFGGKEVKVLKEG